jgi:hypothetical protein
MTMPRRGFLGALAVAPAAVAACSTGAAAKKPAPTLPARSGAEAEGGVPRAESRGVAKVRAFSLAADVEPAFTFRASAARAGER